jgi:glutathione S-transferase
MTSATELRLYDYVASCNCYKVRLLLAQLGFDYERVPIDIFAGDTLTEEYGKINPARSTPVLETDGHFLAESNAILAYLANGTRFLPSDAFAHAQVVAWLIYEQADVMPMIGGLRFRLVTNRLKPTDPDAVQRREGALAVLRTLDEHLASRDYLVAEAYTIADIAVYAYTHLAHEADIDTTPYPNVLDWFTRVERQPHYIEDVEPYPVNAAPGAGRSIYS